MMKKIQEQSLKKLNSVKFIQTYLKFKLHWIKTKKSKDYINHNKSSPSKTKQNKEVKAKLNN